MASLALIYPQLSAEDVAEIQRIRKVHDTRYFGVVEPHITLVFSTDKISTDELVTHVQNTLHDTKAFDLVFDRAKLVENDDGEFFHAFLVPSTGYDEINIIHDALYTGVLASELRHDIPFIPHMGIGTGTQADMEALVQKLNTEKISIKGRAHEISVVQYDGIKVSDYETVVLL